ncbi:MAG: apolipoprotein N-acyltransferase [Alphaproteobacteria bacterium]|nr:apolipoprotein N-acyltransferase [Alphaproteobacteria bacterium]OJV13149.1 MAG: apolipoprotein N-acyltransferase [Alphaproteobacteria bacterium 33-17]
MLSNLNNFIHSRFAPYLLFAIGGLSSFAFAPYYILPLLIPFFVVISLMLKMPHTFKQIFTLSFWLFLGHFVVGLYWICISLFTDIESFWFLVPFALFSVPAYVALYPALAVSICNKIKIHNPYLETLAFASVWVMFEMFREIIFWGFPWNMIGYTFSGYLPLLQSANVIGVYGLSFVVVFVFLLLAKYITTGFKRFLVAPIIILIIMTSFGYFRLKNNQPEFTDKTVKIIQANIEQKMKWRESERYNNIMKHIKLSQGGKSDFVIWSESSFPELVDIKRNLSTSLTQSLEPHGVLITGAVRTEMDSPEFKIWNSIIAIQKEGKIVDYYDKVKLVPFGEFIPFKEFLPLPKITHGSQNFEFSDRNDSSLTVNGLNILPLICYEAIFPKLNYNRKKHYDAILNLTNDAWFGDSSGPYQHYAMAKTRSVELGLPLIRAAGTGISAVTDSYGREVTISQLNKQEALDSNIPKSANKGFYARKLDKSKLFAAFLIIVMLSLVGDKTVRRVKSK